jgi:hypothetical protein
MTSEREEIKKLMKEHDIDREAAWRLHQDRKQRKRMMGNRSEENIEVKETGVTSEQIKMFREEIDYELSRLNKKNGEYEKAIWDQGLRQEKQRIKLQKLRDDPEFKVKVQREKESPSFLIDVIEEIKKTGVTGEEDTLLVLIIVAMTRLVKEARPESKNLLLSDVTGIGKDFVTKKTLETILPEEDYLHITKMSKEAFTY